MPRHSRAHVRFHRDRIVRNREAQARHVAGIETDRPGELANAQALLGCGRARCGVCHPTKRWHRGTDRQRAKREWRALELVS
jgi:hypothetical protein